MTDNYRSNRISIDLRCPASTSIIGHARLDLCEAEQQIIIHGIDYNSGKPSIPLLAAALKSAINNLLAGQYNSAMCWPPFEDTSFSAILDQAGFRRTGLFMRHAAFNEDGYIEFHRPSETDMNEYRQRSAPENDSMNTSHPLLKIAHQFEERFVHTPLPTDETILALINAKKWEAVGLLWGSFHQEGSDRAVFIEEIGIFQDARRKGFGTQAIKALGNSSFGKTIDVVSLFVQPENLPAYALYKKLAFQPGRYEFTYIEDSVRRG